LTNNLFNQIESTLSNIVNALRQSEAAKAAANVAKNVAVTAVTLGLIPIIASIIGSAPAAIHLTTYGFSLSMEAIGITKRRKSWGRVYDSTTGKGIDLALVRLYDQETMKLISTIVTDPKGHYTFQPTPGSYAITVNKQGYIFPTQIFTKYGVGKISKLPSRINGQYVGQLINITDKDNYLNIDIPIDPVKPRVGFFLKLKLFSRSIIDLLSVTFPDLFIPLLIIGSLSTIFAAVVIPDKRNILLAVIYILATLGYLISLIVKTGRISRVLDSATGKPIDGAVVSLFDKEYDTLKETRITDRYGRFSILAQRGKYYLKASKEGYGFSTEKSRSVKNSNKLIYRGEVIQIKSPSFINVVVSGESKKPN
jgi:5-hydroxyisourate hydrolase-like protein (transthyretin family)